MTWSENFLVLLRSLGPPDVMDGQEGQRETSVVPQFGSRPDFVRSCSLVVARGVPEFREDSRWISFLITILNN
jgi:hypothetical protein